MNHVAAAVLAAALCAPIAGAEEMRAKIDTYACKDREFMEEYKSFVVDLETGSGNTELALSMVMLATETMELLSRKRDGCFSIEKGESVDVVTSGPFSGILTVSNPNRAARYYALAGFFK